MFTSVGYKHINIRYTEKNISLNIPDDFFFCEELMLLYGPYLSHTVRSEVLQKSTLFLVPEETNTKSVVRSGIL